MNLIRLECGHHFGHRKEDESLKCRKCPYEPYFEYPPHEMFRAGIIGEKATPEQMKIFNEFHKGAK